MREGYADFVLIFSRTLSFFDDAYFTQLYARSACAKILPFQTFYASFLQCAQTPSRHSSPSFPSSPPDDGFPSPIEFFIFLLCSYAFLSRTDASRRIFRCVYATGCCLPRSHFFDAVIQNMPMYARCGKISFFIMQKAPYARSLKETGCECRCHFCRAISTAARTRAP